MDVMNYSGGTFCGVSYICHTSVKPVCRWIMYVLSIYGENLTFEKSHLAKQGGLVSGLQNIASLFEYEMLKYTPERFTMLFAQGTYKRCPLFRLRELYFMSNVEFL